MDLLGGGSSGMAVYFAMEARGICDNRVILSKLMSKAVSAGLASFAGILKGGESLMFGKFASTSVGIDTNIRHFGSTGI